MSTCRVLVSGHMCEIEAKRTFMWLGGLGEVGEVGQWEHSVVGAQGSVNTVQWEHSGAGLISKTDSLLYGLLG